MTDVNHARGERVAIAELLTEVGPDRPTVCDGWSTRDLAAHLVLRDRRPLAALGIVLPPLAGYTARVQSGLAATPFSALIDRIRTPPRWSPRSYPPLERLTDTLEMFLHHEDIRRGGPEPPPRPLRPDLADALWGWARRLARLRLRRFPAAVRVAAPGRDEVRAGGGSERLELAGEPGELVLFLSGRQRVARVELAGPPALAERLHRTRLTM